VGVSLGFTGIHPGRSAFKHLQVCAIAAGIAEPRINEVLELVNLSNARNRKAGAFSTGMKQRLSLATALLGDPQVIVLDEPVNGLDPEGIVEVRHLLRNLASEGRTILLSSHVLSEVQQTVDDVVIIRKGEKVKDCSLAELIEESRPCIHVLSPTPEKFQEFKLGEVDIQSNRVTIYDTHTKAVGNFAFTNGIEIYELFEEKPDIEQVFLQLTGESHV
jgi:ABC-2 type transport system ATP-binding protein